MPGKQNTILNVSYYAVFNTCGSMLKRVTSGWAHCRGLAPAQQGYEKTSQRWRVVGDTASDLTDLGFEPQASCTD